MKKISLLFALFISMAVFAQEKQFIEVNYQTEIKMELDDVMQQIPAQERAFVREMLKQELDKGVFIDYTLKTNGNESAYQIVEQISNAQDQVGIITQQIKQVDKGALYKNLSAKEYRKPVELPGQKFLLKDKLPEMNWQISREKDNVAGFEVRKATGSYVYNNDTIDAVAWYTPKITVKDGPNNLWGLPGIILKAKYKMQGADWITTATNVAVLEDEIKIEIPNDGKEVTEEEFYAEIKALQERYKEMMGGGVDAD